MSCDYMFPDALDDMFRMQRELNAYVGEKHHIPQLVNPDAFPPEEKIAWILKYNKALRKESEELDDCEDWKWWHESKESFDWHNAKVEIVDMWHFLMSITIMAEITPEDLFKIYEQKWLINKERQDKGYSKATKTEDDNQSIQI